MFRILVATVLGAVVFFIWGALAWTVLQVHSDTLKPLDNESAVLQALSRNIDEPGMYFFPAFPPMDEDATDEQTEAQMNEWRQRHETGPVGILSLHTTGFEAMTPQTFARGFGINLIMALLASTLLAAAAGSLRWFIARLIFVMLLGATVAVSTHLTYWNYLHFHTDYTVMMVIDNLIGWTAAGVVLAAVIKPKPA